MMMRKRKMTTTVLPWLLMILLLPPMTASPATTVTTDPCTAAIQSIEENKGFSNDDLALAAMCIMSNEGLAKMYILLKS
jgi:hypothetical protein